MDITSGSVGGLAVPQIRCDRRELLQCRLEIIGYLLGYKVGILKVGGVLEALVPDPGEVEFRPLTAHDLLVGAAASAALRIILAVGGGAVVTVFGVVETHELVEVLAPQGGPSSG